MTTKSSGAITHDLKPEQMTPEERDQLATDWIQDNAPGYVLQYLDQDANKTHLYVVSLEMGMDDLEKQNKALEAVAKELIRLHEFYKNNTFGCDMPGSEKYSSWLMGIVRMAQEATK